MLHICRVSLLPTSDSASARECEVRTRMYSAKWAIKLRVQEPDVVNMAALSAGAAGGLWFWPFKIDDAKRTKGMHRQRIQKA